MTMSPELWRAVRSYIGLKEQLDEMIEADAPKDQIQHAREDVRLERIVVREIEKYERVR